MKIATIIIRTLLGLLLLFASIAYFFHLVPEEVPTGKIKIFNDGIVASVYLMPLVKIVELICGILFVSGKFMRIAPLLLLPISLNILMVHVFMEQEHLPIGLFLFCGNLFLIYRNWNDYRNLFTA